MSGYEKCRFVDVSEQDLQEFTCGICLDIFKNPLFSTCCGQTYCSHCINEWLNVHNSCPNDRKPLTIVQLVKPPKVVLNLLNNLQIKCEFQSIGCEMVVRMSDLETHLKRCKFNPEKECENCGLINGLEHNCIFNLKIRVECLSEEIKRLRDGNDISINENSINNSNISTGNQNTDRTIRIIRSKLPREIETYTIDMAKISLSQFNIRSHRDRSAFLVQMLDDKFGKPWHCFTYFEGGSTVHYNAERYIYFKIGPACFVIFKSA